MHRLLKYFIPIFLAVIAMLTAISQAESVSLETPSIDLQTDSEAETPCCIEPLPADFDISVPPMAASGNVVRLQNAQQRTQNVSQSYVILCKAKDAMHSVIASCRQRELLIKHSLFTEPVQRLISFGMLII